MYWSKRDDQGRRFGEQGRDWRSEREREWAYGGAPWRRESRDWGEPRGGEPGRETHETWAGAVDQRDWRREGRGGREDWAGRESWQRGPHAGPGREYREQEWRPPGYAAADYGREGWYGDPGAWRQQRETHHRERGGEDWGVWPGATRERRFEHRAPKGYKRSDKRVMEDVCDAFMIDDRLDPREIEVEVLDGVVILRGSVSRRHEKYLAEEIADGVLGVKDIENHIRISDRSEARRETERERAAEPRPTPGGAPVSG